jgi:hypothetical protein
MDYVMFGLFRPLAGYIGPSTLTVDIPTEILLHFKLSLDGSSRVSSVGAATGFRLSGRELSGPAGEGIRFFYTALRPTLVSTQPIRSTVEMEQPQREA